MENVNCFCGNQAAIRTSWTNNNPGQRFWSCPQIDSHCDFFSWLDPPMCARSRQIIPGLLSSRNEIQETLDAMAVGYRRMKFCLIFTLLVVVFMFFM
ncbi:zinc finger, GRF-type [Artemisia annua]|uniref:Zinc finger, GRF-type n=1 Tax=Artemisia annua TaxID=35608 RepID=A0A2U1LAS8_ARTAN|nr:zinc finger, GRF-type [Artemisia annua]